MNIYLVQHGKPIPKEEDPERSLSAQGKEDVEKMAAFLMKAGIEVYDIFHSGKTRARDTAEIIASKLNPDKKPIKKGGLSPLDEVKIIAKDIEQIRNDFMIVGHLPHLAKLISFLITGNETNPIVSFKQGSVVCLEKREEGNWSIAWMLVPGGLIKANIQSSQLGL